MRSLSATGLSRRALLELGVAAGLGACSRGSPAGGTSTAASATGSASPTGATGEMAATSAVESSSAPLGPSPTPRPESGWELMIERFPRLAGIPRVALGEWPTPLEPAPALAAELGLTTLFMKRDDLSSRVFGGGKVRKLEPILAEARASGRGAVITFGGAGSNHTVATAAFAPRVGLQVIVELAGQPRASFIRERILANLALGAEVRVSTSVHDSEVEAQRRAARDPSAPFVIATGGSSAAGDLGFVAAGFELAADLRAVGVDKPVCVVAAAGTAGSVAGLSVGLALAGLANARVLAVRASSAGTSSPRALRDLQRAVMGAITAMSPELRVTPAPVSLDGGFLGRGYGYETEDGRAATALTAKLASVSLDPVYTSKAMAGLVKRAPSFKDEAVVFWCSQPTTNIDVSGVDPARIPEELRAL
ncbi:MAG: pyridoxal-phosphate dependent enzyme [Polyangiaceae bacterium]